MLWSPGVNAPGSTLGIDARPAIGVDPGRWTGIVVGVGREAIDASTPARSLTSNCLRRFRVSRAIQRGS